MEMVSTPSHNLLPLKWKRIENIEIIYLPTLHGFCYWDVSQTLDYPLIIIQQTFKIKLLAKAVNTSGNTLGVFLPLYKLYLNWILFKWCFRLNYLLKLLIFLVIHWECFFLFRYFDLFSFDCRFSLELVSKAINVSANALRVFLPL